MADRLERLLRSKDQALEALEDLEAMEDSLPWVLCQERVQDLLSQALVELERAESQFPRLQGQVRGLRQAMEVRDILVREIRERFPAEVAGTSMKL